VCRSVSQCVAVYRSVLQSVAVCCSVLQSVAACCNVMPNVRARRRNVEKLAEAPEWRGLLFQ